MISPMVMCGPHGVQFSVPIELRLPHKVSQDDEEQEEVKILIDHF